MHWLAGAIDNAVGGISEWVVAILVVAEIVILFAGVVARYVFHKPLVWSDELASILFLWLAMLGAVVAFRRGEHMRMTALRRQGARAAARASSSVALAAALAFLLLIILPRLEFAARGRRRSSRRRWKSPTPGAPPPCRSASA